MATKAESFRYREERSGPKKSPKIRVRRDIHVDTSKPGVSATDRKVRIPVTRKSASGRKPARAKRLAKNERRRRSAGSR